MHYNAVFIFICFNITFVRCPFNYVRYSGWSRCSVELWFHRYARSEAKQNSFHESKGLHVIWCAGILRQQSNSSKKEKILQKAQSIFFSVEKQHASKICPVGLSFPSLMKFQRCSFLFSCWRFTGISTGTRWTCIKQKQAWIRKSSR